MRGSSGAELVDLGHIVLKRDTVVTGRRVRDQGIWLHLHDQSRVLPRASVIHHDGYEVEKLTMCELPTTWKETRELCEEILGVLERDLWELDFSTCPVPALVRPDEFAHLSYITELLDDVDMRKQLRRTLHNFTKQIHWYNLVEGRTHGDGIIDNLAYRRSSAPSLTTLREPVLIDPIPACPALPDVRALDVGRVLQSAAGYEVIRYGAKREVLSTPLTERLNVILNSWLSLGFDLNEARAALHFAVIHTLRGVRTAQRVAPDKVDALKDLVNHLVEETAKWMQ